MNKFESQNFKFRVKALYRTWKQKAVTSTFFALLISLSFNTHEVWVWLGGYLVMGSYFLFLSYNYASQIDDPKNLKKLKMYLEHWQTQSIFFASMWATLAVVTMHYPADQRLLFLIAIVGVSSANMLSSATFRNISLIHSAILVPSFIGTYLYAKPNNYIPICVMVLLYWALVSRIQKTLFLSFQMNLEPIGTPQSFAKDQKNKKAG